MFIIALLIGLLITVVEPMVNELYDGLVEQAKQVRKPGCGFVALILIAASIAALGYLGG